jgi:hypothetical protein
MVSLPPQFEGLLDGYQWDVIRIIVRNSYYVSNLKFYQEHTRKMCWRQNIKKKWLLIYIYISEDIKLTIISFNFTFCILSWQQYQLIQYNWSKFNKCCSGLSSSQCKCPPFCCLTLSYKHFVRSVGRHESIPRNIQRDRSHSGWWLLLFTH